MIDLRRETVLLSEARRQLHDAIWPSAQSGKLDKKKAKKDRETLDPADDRLAEIDNEILAALRRDELCIRYQRANAWHHFEPSYWRGMDDHSALGRLSLGKFTISENDVPRDVKMTLMQPEFEEFKRRVMDGDPSSLVDLSDALAFIAAGVANEATAMRWRCELKRIHGLEGWISAHSDQFQVALRRLQKAWRSARALPTAQPADNPEVDEQVAAEFANRYELRPYGPGQGKIEPKDPHDRYARREWRNVRFYQRDITKLLGAPDAAPAATGSAKRSRTARLEQTALITTRINAVVADANRLWPDRATAPSAEAMANHLCGVTGKCHGYAPDSVRPILEGRYPFQLMHAIKGYRR